MLSEEEVYTGAKRWLIKNGFLVLAGQPARGVDHLPVIEIKDPTGDKGSKFSYKPDLVAFKDNLFYIIECKPLFDNGDNLKIQDVLSSSTRLNNFYLELSQYNLLKRADYTKSFREFSTSVRGVLAYSGMKGPDIPLYHLIVESWTGTAKWYD